ncbi:hypothetical protein JOC28_001913 [Streptococcus loxodontisalivarius]|uniref:DUF3427 domain-containing protein n=1 Tax=Streptococcus loxodontisalivarius TaxID=1349415 RepID=A0ABS2PU67_9STRE|nr:hypothetical protein [Streptococcus loxodontisalivarius]
MAIMPLFFKKDDEYYLNELVLQELDKNEDYRTFFMDVIESGLLKSQDYPEIFTLGQKYSRRDVIKLMNFAKDENPQNVGGYKIDKETNSCPIFITYHKSDDINESIKYEDELVNESLLYWFSKNKRKMTSPDVQSIVQSSKNDLRLELFVKKNDAEGGDFYYLGPLSYVEDSAEQIERSEGSVVSMLLRLQEPIKADLFHYLTSK